MGERRMRQEKPSPDRQDASLGRSQHQGLSLSSGDRPGRVRALPVVKRRQGQGVRRIQRGTSQGGVNCTSSRARPRRDPTQPLGSSVLRQESSRKGPKIEELAPAEDQQPTSPLVKPPSAPSLQPTPVSQRRER